MEKIILNEAELAYEMEFVFKDLLCATVEKKENLICLTFEDGSKFKVEFTKA
ncbi:MAG: hypothetical protein J5993_02770 [Clostridia bacterium]|nr:hypothetical protein [Clostridia bacterium]